MLNLQLLNYFVAVADERSFTRAAARLYVSPATLSGGIKSLEQRLGVTLVERSTRAVRLSTAGEELLPHAKELLGNACLLERTATALAGRPRIRAGTITGFGGSILHAAASRLADAGHDVDLEIKVSSWQDASAGLASGESDIAILVGPNSIDSNLHRRRLWDEPVAAVISSRHPLAGQPSIDIGALDEVGFIWCRDGDEVAHAYWRLDHVRGKPPHHTRMCESPQELLLSVRRGRGVCCVPVGFRDLYGFADLTLLPIDGAPRAAIDIAWPLDAPLDIAFMVEAIVAQATVQHSNVMYQHSPDGCDRGDSAHRESRDAGTET